jgi:signal peptidase I
MYTGYAIVIVYVVYAFPRLSWEMGSNISQSHSIALWIVNLISAAFPFVLYLVLWNYRTQIAWNVMTLEEYKNRKSKPIEKKRTIWGIILENVNILIQAILIVIVIQHFVFQPYLIPSESMVPTFLVNDRPLVFKFQSGPAIPLTDIKIPIIVEPKRGTVVVFENPSYVQNNLEKKLFQHFIFLATFSLVDIDPAKLYLVKRVIAGPGEKIEMIDDVVYVKKRGDPEFKICAEDGKNYSHVNLYSENENIRHRIGDLRITEQERKLLDFWDAKKNNTTVAELAGECKKLDAYLNRGLTSAEKKILLALSSGQVAGNGNAFSGGLLYANMTKVYEKYIDHLKGGAMPLKTQTDMYSLGSKKLNLLFHILCLTRMKLSLDLLRTGMRVEDLHTRPQITGIENEIVGFEFYINDFYDRRNFPEFPEGDGNYIPEKEYFLMGDNRYNSQDFRYADLTTQRKLDAGDDFSYEYYSQLKPHTLNYKKILGIVAFRIWPFDRFGIVK